MQLKSPALVYLPTYLERGVEDIRRERGWKGWQDSRKACETTRFYDLCGGGVEELFTCFVFDGKIR